MAFAAFDPDKPFEVLTGAPPPTLPSTVPQFPAFDPDAPFEIIGPEGTFAAPTAAPAPEEPGIFETITAPIAEFAKEIPAGTVELAAVAAKGGAQLQQAFLKGDEAVTRRLVENIKRDVPTMSDEEYANFQRKLNITLHAHQLIPFADFIRKGADQNTLSSDQRKTLIGLAEFVIDPMTPVEERKLFTVGEALEELSKDLSFVEEGVEPTIPQQLGRGIGSLFAGIIATVATGGAGATILFSTAGAGEAAERTREEGGTSEQQQITAIMGLVPGLTDRAPVELLLARVPKVLRGRFVSYLRRLGAMMAAEGGQEAMQEFMQNWINREVVDPNQSLTEGLPEAGGLGAGVGGIAETFFSLLGIRRRGPRGRAIPPPAEPAPEGVEDTAAPTPPPAEATAVDQAREAVSRTPDAFPDVMVTFPDGEVRPGKLEGFYGLQSGENVATGRTGDEELGVRIVFENGEVYDGPEADVLIEGGERADAPGVGTTGPQTPPPIEDVATTGPQPAPTVEAPPARPVSVEPEIPTEAVETAEPTPEPTITEALTPETHDQEPTAPVASTVQPAPDQADETQIAEAMNPDMPDNWSVERKADETGWRLVAPFNVFKEEAPRLTPDIAKLWMFIARREADQGAATVEPAPAPLPAVPVGFQADLLGGPPVSAEDLALRQRASEMLPRLRAAGLTDEEIGGLVEVTQTVDPLEDVPEIPEGVPDDIVDTLFNDPELGSELSRQVAPSAPAPLPEPTPETTPSPAISPDRAIANDIAQRIASEQTVTSKELFEAADDAFGGTQAQGIYSPAEAYDALEFGLNLHILDAEEGIDPSTDNIREATDAIARLETLRDRLPTFTRRTGETIEFQQFSTPPAYAYLAAWAANIGANDSVLEPSAGTGNIAIMAEKAGAKVVANELAPRRASILKALGFRTFTEDAAQLENILPLDVRPTVVVMNPPFSRTAGRLEGVQPFVAADHIKQALMRLEDGGRLVAIVGKGMASGRPRFADFWGTIRKRYTVRANVGIPGAVYKKQGTAFDTRLIIIDKTGPHPADAKIVTGDLDSLEKAVFELASIRNDRTPPRERAPDQPAGQAPDPSGRGSVEPGRPVSPPTPDVGVGRREDRPRVERDDDQPVADRTSARDEKPSVEPGVLGRPVEPERIGRPDPERGGVEDLGRDRGVAGELADVEAAEKSDFEKDDSEFTDSVFVEYKPQRLVVKGAKPHPGTLMQSAAMAAVLPPKPSYTPTLPKSVISKGNLSDAQIESIVYAGQAHEQMLPAIEGETAFRRGFFLGDGTGVGKGRQVAGVILDNIGKGRKKHIWITANDTQLFRQGRADFTAIEGNPKLFFKFPSVKERIKRKEGILFLSYNKMARDDRRQQIIDWVGEDFDGVLVFDEAHRMGNAISEKGPRGRTQPSQTALAGIELQQALPNARIVYASATGATEVRNLAYGERLGIWGLGTPFESKLKFINDISQGGIATMELIARDMKALGAYMSRNLDYRGITYDRLEHELTPAQEAMYDRFADAWQVVLRNFNAALALTATDENGKIDPKAKAKAMSQLWGHNQRFFNQVLTSFQIPSLIESMEADIEKGHSVVIQLVNTNEAATNRALEKAGGSFDEDEDFDITPREALIEFVRNAFPVAQREKFTDRDGNVQWQAVLDSEDNPVLNAQAVRARDALIADLEEIAIPRGALDMIIDHFGVDTVAEVTGRSKRFVLKPDERTGEIKRAKESRSSRLRLADIDAFNDDKKRVLLFSEAGGTGADYHASIEIANQRLRRHYLVQPGWRADVAVQGLGRTHRSAQKQPPEYILVTTNLKAQKRFVSSVARRLAQLGALTKGQRKAAGAGEIFSEKDDLENEYASAAVSQLITDIHLGEVEGITIEDFAAETGLDLVDGDGLLRRHKIPGVPQFLNRLLSIKIARANRIFDEFDIRMTRNVDLARERGTLNTGVETYRADRIEKLQERVVYTEPRTGAQTRYVELVEHTKTNPLSFDDVERLPGEVRFWVRNRRSGFVYAVKSGHKIAEADGTITEFFQRVGVSGKATLPRAEFSPMKYDKISAEEAKKVWDEKFAEVPEFRSSPLHLITGVILPIWDRLGKAGKVYRLETDEGDRFLGRVIAPDKVQDVLVSLGANVEAQISPAEAVNAVLNQGKTLKLVNRWTITRRKLAGEDRIEIVGPGGTRSEIDALEKQGVISEVVRYSQRFFIPVGPNATEVMRRILEFKPIAQIIDPVRHQDEDATPTGGEGFSTTFNVGFNPIEALRNFPRLLQMAREDADRLSNRLKNTTALTPEEAARIQVDPIAAEKDVFILRRIFDTPLSMTRRFPELNRIIQNGMKADLDSSRFINRLGREWDAIRKKLTKDQFESLSDVLLVGDSEGVEYTGAELSEQGIDAEVIRAYRTTRKLFEKLGRFVDQHERAMRPQWRRRKAQLLRMMARIRVMDEPAFRSLYGKRSRLRSKLRRGEGDLEEFDKIDAKLARTSVRRKQGYFPHHFFGTWRLFRLSERMNEDGETEPYWEHMAGKDGFFRSREDAIRSARAYAKDHPETELRVAPVQFQMPNSSATQLTDPAYWRFLGNMSNALGVEGQELREMIKGVAVRKFRRRIAGFSRYRAGVQGYSRDVDRVVVSHIGEVVRYVMMDTLKYDAINTLERLKLSPNARTNRQFPQLKQFMDTWLTDMMGQKRPGSWEESFDNLLLKDSVLTKPLAVGLEAGIIASGAVGVLANPMIGLLAGSYVGYRFYQGRVRGGSFPTRSITGAMLSDMAHLKLGAFFNVMSPLVNLSQTILNTWPLLGTKYTSVGMEKLAAAGKSAVTGSPNTDWQLLMRADIASRFRFTEVSPKLFEREGRLAFWSLFLFNSAEQFNRAVSYLGAYHQAIDRGANQAEALREAEGIGLKSKGMIRTQFLYSNANKPELLRNTLLRVPGQFKNFVAQEVVFALGILGPGSRASFDAVTGKPVNDEARNAIATMLRFLTAQFVVAGGLGIAGLGVLDWLIEFFSDWSPIEEMKWWGLRMQAQGELAGTLAQLILRGLPALINNDVSTRIGLGEKFLPLQIRDWKGAWWSTIEKAGYLGERGGTIVDHVKNLSSGLGAPLKAIEAAANGMPLIETLATDPRKVIEALGDGEARLTNPWKNGNLEYEPTTGELIIKAIGGRPLIEAQMGDVRDIVRRQKEQFGKSARSYLREIVRISLFGDPRTQDREIKAIVEEALANDVPLSKEQIKRAILDAQRPRMERLITGIPKALRPEIVPLAEALRR